MKKEIWKEFFRLKREEISYWFKYSFLENIFIPVLGIFVILHCVVSLASFLLYIAIPSENCLVDFWLAVSFLPYICAFVIWIFHTLLDWLFDNWRQAVRNVEEL